MKLHCTRLAFTTMALAGVSAPAAASIWVMSQLKEVPVEARIRPATPQPVQLTFQFQTSGKPNKAATKYVAPFVDAELKSSAIVAPTAALTQPAAKLDIVMNDIPDKDAFGKGFGAGLTFGLAGVVAGDTYDVALRYIPADGGAPVTRNLAYRIIFKFGNKTVPEGAEKVKNLKVAIQQMVHLTLSNGLNQIAGEPSFTGRPAVPAPAATPSPLPVASPAEPFG